MSDVEEIAAKLYPKLHSFLVDAFLADPITLKTPGSIALALAKVLADPRGDNAKRALVVADLIREAARPNVPRQAEVAMPRPQRDTEAWAREWRRLQNILTVLVQGPHFDLHADIQEGARIFLLAVLLETGAIPDIVARDPKKELSFEAELVDYVRMTPGHPVDFGPLAAALLDDRLKTLKLLHPFGVSA